MSTGPVIDELLPALDRLCAQLAIDPTNRLAAALITPTAGQTVSALLATYNRCPVDPGTGRLGDNPLTWALDTLLAQEGDALAEIVVVDDGSTDHTQAVLDIYSTMRTVVPIVVRRHREHRGAFAARNAGIAAALGELLLFGDDDCLFPPSYVAGAVSLIVVLRETDTSVCTVTLPFYYRALRPRQAVPLDQIGRLDRERAWYATNFHCYPADYLPDPPLDDAGLHAPFPTQAINGTCIVTADALRRAGGFADLTGWRTSYTDHLLLAAALTDNGGRIYHCPDPRLGAPHLKFGAAGRYPLHPDDLDQSIPTLGRRFGELVALSAVPRTATGCRVAPDEFLPEMLGSFFAFYLAASHRGATAWGVMTHRDFVQHGIVYTQAVAEPPTLAERRDHWRQGLARGGRFASNRPPHVPAERIQRILDQITGTVGEAPIRTW